MFYHLDKKLLYGGYVILLSGIRTFVGQWKLRKIPVPSNI